MTDDFGDLRRRLDRRRARELWQVGERVRERDELRQYEDRLVQDYNRVVIDMLANLRNHFFRDCRVQRDERELDGIVARWSVGRPAQVIDLDSPRATRFREVWQAEVCVDLIVQEGGLRSFFRCLRPLPEGDLELVCDLNGQRLEDTLAELVAREHHLE